MNTVNQIPVNIVVSNQQQFHWHSELEIVYLLQGSCDIDIGHRSFNLSKNNICIIDCNRPHYINKLLDNTLYLSLCININNIYPGLMSNINGSLLEFNPSSTYVNKELIDKDLKAKVANIVKLLFQNNIKIKEIKLYCEDILQYMIRNCDNYNSVFFDTHDDRSKRAKAVTQYLYDNYNEKIALSEVANLANISVSYLAHLFKDITGASFHHHISSIRSENSIKFLLASNHNITNISYNCGFSDPKYYNKMFKAIMNITPFQYRKMYQKTYRELSSTPIKDLKKDKTVRELVLAIMNNYLK